MSHRPDIAELMLAIDSLEEVRVQMFDKLAPSVWEMESEREMMRALAILHAHVRQLIDEDCR